MKMKKKLLALFVGIMVITAGCSEADTVSQNISK